MIHYFYNMCLSLPFIQGAVMISALVYAYSFCSFPTSFEALGFAAACCGTILFLTACLLFLRSRIVAHGRLLLVVAPLPAFAAIWSFLLVYVTHSIVLVCAGPGASADLIKQAKTSYRALMLYQMLVTWTEIITACIVLLVVGFGVWFLLLYRRRKVVIE
jgi:hypothetical protein